LEIARFGIFGSKKDQMEKLEVLTSKKERSREGLRKFGEGNVLAIYKKDVR
jgi:hypothetical protein